MISSIYITGFRDSDLAPDEQNKLEEFNKKYSDIIKIMDSRDPNFKSVKETFKSEGKNIILYAESNNTSDDYKEKIIESAKELKSTFPSVNIEVNDEEKQLL